MTTLLNAKKSLAFDHSPEIQMKAVSLANQIEKNDLWKEKGFYEITSTGLLRATFTMNGRSLIYFAKGNAFIKGYLKTVNHKKEYWCADD